MSDLLRRPVGRDGQPVMVERVARAIRKAGFGTERGWVYEIPAAWAALEALRKPTQAMFDAAEQKAFVGYTGTPSLSPDDAWEAMLEEAMRLPALARSAAEEG